MKYCGGFFVALFTFLFLGCITLNPTYISKKKNLYNYKYVYTPTTSERNSVQGSVVGTAYGVFGGTESSSVSPSEWIAGYFMKKGWIRIPEIKDEIAHQTIIVNYGDGNVRNGLGEVAVEVTLQILDAKTYEVLCTVRADGQGDSETTAIRNAINKCLDAVFSSIAD